MHHLTQTQGDGGGYYGHFRAAEAEAREVKSLTQGHIASKRQRKDLNPDKEPQGSLFYTLQDLPFGGLVSPTMKQGGWS